MKAFFYNNQDWLLMLLGIFLLLVLLYTIRILFKTQKIVKDLSRRGVITYEQLVKTINKNDSINSLLDKLLFETACDRAFVMQFHNGSYTMNGNSMPFISTTHEQCRGGISSELANFQKVIVQQISDMAKKILEDGKVGISDLELQRRTTDECYKLYPMLNKIGIKSFYIVKLTDLHGFLLGCIGVQYVRNLYTFNQDDWKKLHDTSEKIGAYLTDVSIKKPQSIFSKLFSIIFLL